MTQKNPYTSLGRDMFFILLSVLVAILVVRFGVVQNILTLAEEGKILGTFIAGFFFTSAFTIAPASIALAELSKTLPLYTVAFWGALGAVVGDLVIFLFVKDRFGEDLMEVLGHYKSKKVVNFLHRGFFRWLTPLIGALIIASPLPDEIGLTMMGISKVKTSRLIVVSFIMNFLGVLLVAGVASTF